MATKLIPGWAELDRVNSAPVDSTAETDYNTTEKKGIQAIFDAAVGTGYNVERYYKWEARLAE